MDLEVIKEKLGWALLVILVCVAIFTLSMVITASIIVLKEDANLLKDSVGENFIIVSDDKTNDFRMVKIQDKETGVYYLWVYLKSRPKESQLTVMYDKDGNVLCGEVEK